MFITFDFDILSSTSLAFLNRGTWPPQEGLEGLLLGDHKQGLSWITSTLLL